VPKIIINDTINFFFKAISILLISNYNSFRVCLVKLLPYILFEKYIYILAIQMASPGKQHCANYIGTLSFPIVLPTLNLIDFEIVGMTEIVKNRSINK